MYVTVGEFPLPPRGCVTLVEEVCRGGRTLEALTGGGKQTLKPHHPEVRPPGTETGENVHPPPFESG